MPLARLSKKNKPQSFNSVFRDAGDICEKAEGFLVDLIGLRPEDSEELFGMNDCSSETSPLSSRERVGTSQRELNKKLTAALTSPMIA